MTPRVSILIPCFDAADTVGDAIRSALAQTLEDVEILVVDDGSRDGTRDVLRSFGARIRWEATPHRGRNPARNLLLAWSRGEWLQYLDADDRLLPTKLERQLAVAGGDADLVVAPCRNEAGRTLRAPDSKDPWQELLAVRLGVTSSNLFRREAVEAAGGWDPTLLAGQEYALMQAMLRRDARVAFHDEPLVVKGRRGASSLWRSDPARARRDGVRNLTGAIRHLEATGELGPAHRRVAAQRLHRIARWYRERGDPYADEVLALVRPLEGPESLRSRLVRRLRAVGRRRGGTSRSWRATPRA